MKKILIVIFLIYGYSNAQIFEFGAKAGVNFATWGGNQPSDVEGKTGFHVGFVVEIPVNTSLTFQPEFLYSSQGAKTSHTDVYMSNTYLVKNNFTHHYINIPLLIKYNITSGLSVFSGPQIGIFLKGEEKYEYSVDGGHKETGKGKSADFIKELDYAIAAGLGYKLGSRIFLDARYNAGLSHIYDENVGSGDFTVRNNVFQLSLGYML